MRDDSHRRTVAPDFHVKIARGNPRLSRRYGVPACGFGDGQARRGGETVGQQFRENRRHVLDDQNGHGKIGRQTGDEIHQRAGAAGRGADRQHVNAGSCHCAAIASCGVRRRGGGEQGPMHANRTPQRNLGDQFVDQHFQRRIRWVIPDRLHHEVGGAADERTEGCGRGLRGQDVEDDDRQPWLNLPDGGERLDAVHAGHADVEQDDIGLKERNLHQREPAGRGGADHLDARLFRERRRHGLTDHGRVVDDEKPPIAHHQPLEAE